MKAACWLGKGDMEVRSVPDPKIVDPGDAIVEVALTAICGSDLHLYDGYIPTVKRGDILGHEFMGEVVETGREVRSLHPGDRVVVPFAIACGACEFCLAGLWALCDSSNPNGHRIRALYGASPAGLFGYSHLFGGYPGGQAQYVRVPFADVGPLKVPEEVTDEEALFLSDIFPTGYMAAENCGIRPGDTVAVWGCGPVGQFAIRSAYLLGAESVIAIDRFPARLQMAQVDGGAQTINYEEEDVLQKLRELTRGRGPDACIDAVGMESHGTNLGARYDKVKQSLRLENDRPQALRESILACRKGGVVSIAGVYSGLVDKFPIGAAFGKGLNFRMGQTHVQKYMAPLLQRIVRGEIDPSCVITHRLSLDDAPEAYRMFRDKADGCVKAVMDPWLEVPPEEREDLEGAEPARAAGSR